MTDADRYPLGPLAEALGETLASLGRVLGVSGSTWKQYRDHGVSDVVADRLACRAGLHPYEVWPEMLDRQVAEDEAVRRRRRAAAERARYHADPDKRARKQAARARYYAEHGHYERARERRKPYDPAARRAKYLRAKERAAQGHTGTSAQKGAA